MSSVKSAGAAFAGIAGADDGGCCPAGILICALSPRPSAVAAEVIPASCVNRLRVSIAKNHHFPIDPVFSRRARTAIVSSAPLNLLVSLARVWSTSGDEDADL